MFYRWQEVTPNEVRPGVTRRTIVAENVSVSYVELDEGVATPFHTHQNEQVVSVVQGQMEFRTDRDCRILGPGEVVVFAPNIPHQGKALGGKALVWEALSPARHES